ncbi:uncharacterized protein [Triticum aestivum]|nr:uncharacterized protein LOC123151524 isoform X1 [Triticum aestivum]
MALGRLASRVRGSALQVRAAAPRASPPAPCPCVRPMTYSSKPVQGEQQGKGPSRPIDLLRESKWRNAKDDGAGIHTSAPRVPQPAPRTTPLAGGQPVSCRSISSEVVSFGVPALPVARRLSRPDITAYGLTPFGPGQQRRGVAQMPFQPLDNKTAAAKYEELSPEGRRVANLTNMVFNETVKKMKESNRKRFHRINEDVRMLVDKVRILGWTTSAVIGFIGVGLYYLYVFVKGVVEDMSDHSGEIASALYKGYLYTIWSRLGVKFEWKEKWSKKKQVAEKSEAPAKK